MRLQDLAVCLLAALLLAPAAFARGWHRGHGAYANYGAYGHIGYRGMRAPYRCARPGYYPSPYGYHRGYPYRGGPRYGPSFFYAAPFYTPPPKPYIPLTKEERYQGAKKKGDRAVDRGDWPKAVAQYRDAWNRAGRFWGPGSRQAQEASALLTRAEYKLKLTGARRPSGSFRQAMGRGDRAMARGNWSSAEGHYKSAVSRATTSEQAEQAANLLTTVRQRRKSGKRRLSPRSGWELRREPSAE